MTPSVAGTSTAGAAASGAAVPPGGDLSLVAEGEDVDMMADVAAIAGSEGDPLKRLEDALSPIEKYAVRLIEEVRPVMPCPLSLYFVENGFTCTRPCRDKPRRAKRDPQG